MPDQTTLKSALPAPPLNIPPSSTTVKVSVINTTSHVSRIPSAAFFQPSIKGVEFLDCPCYSFLIEHPNGRRLLFDLGVRKDWWNLSAKIVEMIKDGEFKIEVEKGVAEILEENGVEPKSIEAIIWSHYHWDHTGDPSTFPPSTSLLVGPGFKENLTPSYPTNPSSSIRDSDYANRTLTEIDFSSSPLKIGQFPAYDFFSDGSLYLLSSPGHAIGHMCALARTTTYTPADGNDNDTPSERNESAQDTFIFMGGDCAHHGGEFRPTPYLPLPHSISPNPLSPASSRPCPGALFENMHRNKRADEPFLEIADLPEGQRIAHDVGQATQSIRRMEEFDANGNVFTIIAHDPDLIHIVDVFPRGANEWRSKGWADKGRWAFLKDFKQAVEDSEQKD